MSSLPIQELAGQPLDQLRARFSNKLFQEQLPFWDRCGIDHEHGGFLCSLDYDGRRINTDKFVWFQGRGLWVYSFLYNHFDADPRLLEIARQTKDFLFQHYPQPDGWASVVTREGRLRQPGADVYGRYFAIEGLQEYAQASGDGAALDHAVKLFKELFREVTSTGGRSGASQDGPPVLSQGFWMVNVNIATQLLKRHADPEVEEIADRAIEAVIHKHYNPDIGLNTENLYFDFTRPPGEEAKSLLGHSIETLWMVMEEGRRRGDQSLVATCSERIHRHFEVGWDPVFGGLAMWINVDQGGYQWPAERLPGADLEFPALGEYNYTKCLWALDEVLIAMLLVLEQSGACWAARAFEKAQRVIDEKLSMKAKYGQPTYVLLADRRMNAPPHSSRQDNYHRLRALMLNLLTLDRMIAAQESTS